MFRDGLFTSFPYAPGCQGSTSDFTIRDLDFRGHICGGEVHIWCIERRFEVQEVYSGGVLHWFKLSEYETLGFPEFLIFEAQLYGEAMKCELHPPERNIGEGLSAFIDSVPLLKKMRTVWRESTSGDPW